MNNIDDTKISRKSTYGAGTKDAIAEEAGKLFGERGYHGTTMEDIKNATGKSKGNIYYHFKSKDQLLLYITEKSLTRWAEEWEERSQAYQTINEKVYGLFDYFLETYHSPMLKAGLEYANSPDANPEILGKIAGLAALPLGAYERMFAESISQGEVKDANPKRLALIISGILTGMSDKFDILPKEELRELYHAAADVFLNGIK